MKIISLLTFCFICMINPELAQKEFFRKNEYWSSSSNPATTGFFENYYFSSSGTFIHHYGLSGGGYYAWRTTGTYTYSAVKKEITLHKTSTKDVGIVKAQLTTKPFPVKLQLIEIQDTTVIFVPDNNDGKMVHMHRATEASREALNIQQQHTDMQDADTLRVSRSDTTVFKQEGLIWHRPCKPIPKK